MKAAPAAAKREKKVKQDKKGQDALLNHRSEGRNRLQPNLGSSMRGTLLAQLHMLQAQPAAEGSHADLPHAQAHIYNSFSYSSLPVDCFCKVTKKSSRFPNRYTLESTPGQKSFQVKIKSRNFNSILAKNPYIAHHPGTRTLSSCNLFFQPLRRVAGRGRTRSSPQILGIFQVIRVFRVV